MNDYGGRSDAVPFFLSAFLSALDPLNILREDTLSYRRSCGGAPGGQVGASGRRPSPPVGNLLALDPCLLDK